MGFLRFLGQKMNQARSIGSKVLNGVATIGSKVADLAGRAGGLVSAINPEVGAAIQGGAAVVKNIAGVAKTAMTGGSTLGDVAGSARGVVDSVKELPSASSVINSVKDQARATFA